LTWSRARRHAAVAAVVVSIVPATAGLPASRTPVHARHGMVAAAEPLAVGVGVNVLKAGGNAVDAAVAVGFALAVTYPLAGNIGGGGFMVIRLADGRETTIDSDEAWEAVFDANDHWSAFPAAWDDPDRSLEQKQFFAALELCLEALPAKTARVFLMREHMGMETDEICKEMAITSTHCWVLLYRARMALRRCLEMNWFGKEAK